LLLSGEGAEPDPAQAQRWLSGPAARGYAHAQYGLGLLCLRGPSDTVDVGRAELWLSKAAAQGHPGARSALGGLKSAGATGDAAA